MPTPTDRLRIRIADALDAYGREHNQHVVGVDFDRSAGVARLSLRFTETAPDEVPYYMAVTDRGGMKCPGPRAEPVEGEPADDLDESSSADRHADEDLRVWLDDYSGLPPELTVTLDGFSYGGRDVFWADEINGRVRVRAYRLGLGDDVLLTNTLEGHVEIHGLSNAERRTLRARHPERYR